MKHHHLSPARLLLCSLVLIQVASCAQFQQGPQPGLKPQNYVKVGNEQIYITEHGTEGPTVLLIHGYCGAADQWMMVQPKLAKDYRVLSVDLPGFGRSDKYMGDYSTNAMAARMFALLEKKGTKEAHIVAHSWGTSIALAMALMHPERVKSLTLIGVWAYDDQLPPFLVWSQAPGLGEVLFTLFFDQRLDDRMGLSFYNVDAYIDPHAIDLAHEVMDRSGYMAAALAAARGMRYGEMARRYKEIKNRVLIIHGEYDPVTRLPWAKRLHSELPDSRLVVIRNAKHMAMFAAASDVLRALRPFLAGLEPGQAVAEPASPPPETPGPPDTPRTAPAPASTPTLPPPEPDEDEVLQ